MHEARDYTLVASKREIPLFFRGLKRFCEWHSRTKPGGRPSKSPDISPADLDSCVTWDELAHLPRTNESGVGMLLTKCVRASIARASGGKVQVTALILDLDACRDPETGEVAQWAVDIIENHSNTWTEVTPSGTGLHVGFFVVNMPTDFKVKVPVPHAAMPNTKGKRPELQVFGRGVSEYVTFTGDQLLACSSKLEVVDNIDWLLDTFGMRLSERKEKFTLPAGIGDEPDFQTITERVNKLPHGADLILGEWEEVLPGKSASEGFHLLAGHALHAAHGHGEQAVEWILACTAWGQGMVNSADPAKYTRRSWIAKDVVRVGGQSMLVRAADVFDVIEEPAPTQTNAVVPVGGRLRDWRDVADDPPVEWLVEGILPKGAAVVLAGDPGAGKTLLAFDIALHQAHGLPWMGRKTQPTSTLFLAGEGFGGLGARLRAWKTLHPGIEMAPGCYLAIFDGVPDLTRGAEELVSLVAEARSRFGAFPACVTLDTLAAANPGGDENSVEGIGIVMATLAGLRRKIGCSTLLLHHLRKGEPGAAAGLHSLRGSTGIPGAVDVALIAAEDAGAYALYTVKVRDGAETKTPYDIEGLPTGRQRADGAPETGPAVCAFSLTNVLDEAAERLQRAETEENRVVDALRELVTVSSADTLSRAAGIKLVVGRAAVDRAVSRGRIVRYGSTRQRVFKLSDSELLTGTKMDVRDEDELF